MTIPVIHQRTFDQNGGKCSRCKREVVADARDYRSPYFMFREMLCVYCKGRAIVRNGPEGRSTVTYSDAPIDEQTVVRFSQIVLAGCDKAGVAPPEPEYWPRYISIPTDQIEKLAGELVNRFIAKAQRMNPNKRQQPAHKSKADKIALGKRQDDKCCYCGIHMHYDDQERDPEKRVCLATWEHIVNLADDGDWSHRNLVIACRFCNWLRNEMKTTDHEFSVWLYNHRSEFDALRARHIARMKEKSGSKTSQRDAAK